MSEALKVINLDGSLDNGRVLDIQKRFLDLLDQKFNLILNLSNVQAVDLSFLQLLLATKLLARQLNLSVQLANRVSKEALQCFYLCGITCELILNGKELNTAIDERIVTSQ